MNRLYLPLVLVIVVCMGVCGLAGSIDELAQHTFSEISESAPRFTGIPRRRSSTRGLSRAVRCRVRGVV